MCYVAIRAIPMGWTNAVDLIQNFARNFVFDTCGIPPSLEVCPGRPFPSCDAAVVCMDGFDYFTKLRIDQDELRRVQGVLKFDSAGRSSELSRFVLECQRRNLPLNEGKSVLQKFCSSVLGGELDGLRGVLMHARDKNFKFASRTLALLSLPEVPQVALQHWTGIFCFMASFRRPLFCVVQEFSPFITSFGEDQALKLAVPHDVRDEILVAALLAPLSLSNLRARIRPSISISDASEDGGAAGEASKFVKAIDRSAGQLHENLVLNSLEEGPDPFPLPPLFCSICKLSGVSAGAWFSCGVGCNYRLCSFPCWQRHVSAGCINFARRDDCVVLHAEKIVNDFAWPFVLAGLKKNLSRRWSQSFRQ